jgi:enterochelin esterase-like enzyme
MPDERERRASLRNHWLDEGRLVAQGDDALRGPRRARAAVVQVGREDAAGRREKLHQPPPLRRAACVRMQANDARPHSRLAKGRGG